MSLDDESPRRNMTAAAPQPGLKPEAKEGNGRAGLGADEAACDDDAGSDGGQSALSGAQSGKDSVHPARDGGILYCAP